MGGASARPPGFEGQPSGKSDVLDALAGGKWKWGKNQVAANPSKVTLRPVARPSSPPATTAPGDRGRAGCPARDPAPPSPPPPPSPSTPPRRGAPQGHGSFAEAEIRVPERLRRSLEDGRASLSGLQGRASMGSVTGGPGKGGWAARRRVSMDSVGASAAARGRDSGAEAAAWSQFRVLGNVEPHANPVLERFRKVVRKAFMGYKLSLHIKRLRDMFADIQLDPDRMKPVKVLGKGGFGMVHLVDLERPDGRVEQIAIKMLKSGTVDNTALQDFVNEVVLLKKLRHRNIVEFKGIGTFTGELLHVSELTRVKMSEVFLGQEYCSGGTLKRLIVRYQAALAESPGRPYYTWETAFRLLRDIAAGLNYLHQRDPIVVHRDLKPDNILLSTTDPETAVAKVTDFGLSKTYQRRTPGTLADTGGEHGLPPLPPAGGPPDHRQGSGALTSGRGAGRAHTMRSRTHNKFDPVSEQNVPGTRRGSATGQHAQSRHSARVLNMSRTAGHVTEAGRRVTSMSRNGNGMTSGHHLGAHLIPESPPTNMERNTRLAERQKSTVQATKRNAQGMMSPVHKDIIRRLSNAEKANKNLVGLPDGLMEGLEQLWRSVKPTDSNIIGYQPLDLTGMTGSLLYMAPEVFKKQPYNERADVFSFAMIAWEILSHTMVASFLPVVDLPSVMAHAERVSMGWRPELPKQWPQSVRRLLQKSWAPDPQERPTFETILSMIDAIVTTGDVAWFARKYEEPGCCSIQ